MTEKEEMNEVSVTLKVSLSSIDSVSSGIARINSKHLEAFEEETPEVVMVATEDKEKAIKLVSDKLAPKGHIILRQDDIEDLEVEEGDEVEIRPYTKLTDDIKASWQRFKDRFKKDDEEEDEEEEQK